MPATARSYLPRKLYQHRSLCQRPTFTSNDSIVYSLTGIYASRYIQNMLTTLGAQLIDALLCVRMRLDDARATEHTQVFRDLRLAQSQSCGDIPDRTGAVTQKFNNMQAVRFRQSVQRCQHVPNIPQQAYSCQGIYNSPILGGRRALAELAMLV